MEQKTAKIIYEATRLETKWSKRSIQPEKWEDKDEKFRKQFIDVIDKYLSLDKLPTPEEAHNSWVEAYKKMGWKYGKAKDADKKTHPDILPFNDLPKDERDKDAIFLAVAWAVREIFNLYPPIELLLKMKKGDTVGFGNEYYKGKKHWTIKRDN